LSNRGMLGAGTPSRANTICAVCQLYIAYRVHRVLAIIGIQVAAKMNRRHVIKTIAATAALALPGVAWFRLRQTCTDIDVNLGIQNIFGDSCQIREIGEAYRHAHPEEDDVVLLQDLLLTNNVSFDLDKTVQQDFEHGRTVQIHGWILSRTEARRYALFSMRTD